MNINTHKKLYLAIFLFGLSLFIRISYINLLEIDHPIRGDASSYVQYARNLLQHGVFSKSTASAPTPDSFWAPGYPIFISFVAVFSDLLGLNVYNLILILQGVIGAITVVLTFYLGLQFLPMIWAFSATILTALSPHLITMGAYILTETLFIYTGTSLRSQRCCGIGIF
jgi:hypothetical protein